MRIGTRGSALALAQAGAVADALGPEHELVAITTTGDRDRAALDKERWVRELDEALLRGDVDLAVHSAKDVPAHLPEGIVIAAVPVRAPAVDALCGAASLDALAQGARVGTASQRRAAQLRALRDDLQVTDLRGNVDTRLSRLHAGDHDAIVPCAGQGALLLTAREGDEATLAAARALDDPATHACVRAERELVRGLDADCHTPMGAHATLDAAGTMTVTAFVGRVDGSAWLRDSLTVAGAVDVPEALGAQVAARLVSAGAAEVLGR